jgi:hypothetical protein
MLKPMTILAAVLVMGSLGIQSASAAARCPGYLLKSSIKELCWEGAWRPYERDDWRYNKYNNDKYKPGRNNKPKWRFKSGQGGNMKSK